MPAFNVAPDRVRSLAVPGSMNTHHHAAAQQPSREACRQVAAHYSGREARRQAGSIPATTQGGTHAGCSHARGQAAQRHARAQQPHITSGTESVTEGTSLWEP
eukprot:GHVU01181940.1.p2 GENE.GHVU01181940.1~~GHVU01181940.1.p2  ORF type:complete len:103 (+),score=9.65 GHVU01181940.1:457-765(+)